MEGVRAECVTVPRTNPVLAVTPEPPGDPKLPQDHRSTGSTWVPVLAPLGHLHGAATSQCPGILCGGGNGESTGVKVGWEEGRDNLDNKEIIWK